MRFISPIYGKILQIRDFNNFITDLVEYTKQDLIHWSEFDNSPHYAAHVTGGILELMPTADKKLFNLYKYVNGSSR
ncbi:Rossmann-fold NAD(P)-binding domain-containing protein [Francisella persica]|uniref:hypothetical protein n=1 Tax=Francisella persica TaxID=954 RepID=UPI000A93D640